MIIKMMLEEADQYFYCESRKTAPDTFEGIVHFLHKVGDGNAFVRGKTYHVATLFSSRHDALTAAERHGRSLAMQAARHVIKREERPCLDTAAQNSGRLAARSMEKSVC